ncbi:CD209 antigen-like protein E [Clinocottus analis]|uniref:CD209 antigen-like protein E n=1 Tax=Clinocottus analis TaxID=304258 RepID=UPI0035C0447C
MNSLRKKQPSRCVMSLGLLCAVLLVANIGQLIYHASRPAGSGGRDGLQSRLKNLTQEKDLLQQNCLGLSKDYIEIAKQFKDQMVRTAARLRNMPCQMGWRKFGKSCYVVSTEKKDWMESRGACNAEEADLVFIDSRAEQAFVNGLLSSGLNAWIGLTDGVKEGTWTWADGTPANTTFWRAGQRNNYDGNEDCGETVQRSPGVGEWNDDGCSAKQIFICEK